MTQINIPNLTLLKLRYKNQNMATTQHPLLYSFRRCPYAMRARMAISYSGVEVIIKEVELKNKPQSMLDVSPKATVPVLVINQDKVIDESIDIIWWALEKNDNASWYHGQSESIQTEITALVAIFDNEFKPLLDNYKYSSRFPEKSADQHRQQTYPYLRQLDQRLSNHTFLLSDKITVADIAIFPFIRQFAFVDKQWFDKADYPSLQRWLVHFIDSSLFQTIMKKSL